jgi:hypothetical protein
VDMQASYPQVPPRLHARTGGAARMLRQCRDKKNSHVRGRMGESLTGGFVRVLCEGNEEKIKTISVVLLEYSARD